MSIPYIKIYPSDMRALTSRLDKEQKLFIYEAIEDYGIFGVWPELCNGNYLPYWLVFSDYCSLLRVLEEDITGEYAGLDIIRWVRGINENN